MDILDGDKNENPDFTAYPVVAEILMRCPCAHTKAGLWFFANGLYLLTVMECSSITTSLHAFKRMLNRKISPADIQEVIGFGEIIKNYDDDRPYPSVLIYKTINDRPIHVLVGKNETNSECIVVTVYVAGEQFWQPDFKTKK